MASVVGKKRSSRKPPRVEAVSVTLGERLKELRIKADLSQGELGFECELDRTYISLIERGLANPSLWTLATIAHALAITVPDLLKGNTHTVLPSTHAEGTKRRKNQASHDASRPSGTRRSELR